jgi:outer membrane protein assembly factor BamB
MMTCLPRLIALCLLLLIAARVDRAQAEDWPTYMHDNQRTGVTSESLRPPLALQWVFEPAFAPAKGWALPVNGYGARKNKPNVSYDDAPRVIAVGDRCYFCSSGENRIYAIDAAAGTIRWSRFTDAAPRLAPAFWQGRIYFGADDGIFRCLNADDGTLVWQVNAAPRPDLMLGHGRFLSVWPIRGGGMVEDGIAYFSAGLFPYNHLYLSAVDADDGRIVWRRQLDRGGRGAHAPQGYLLATENSLFTTSRIAPCRWSKADGRPIDFHTPFPQIEKAHEYRFCNGGSYAQIWNDQHIVYGRACILAYDPDAELKDKWGKTRKGQLIFNWFNARQAIFHGDTAYLATDYHVLALKQDLLPQMAARECREFEEAYKRLRIADYLDVRQEHARLVAELGGDHSRVRALEQGPLKWGRENWLQWPEVSKTIFGKMARKCDWMSPVTATEAMVLSGAVIFAGGDKEVVAIDAHNGKVLWQFDTGSRVRGLAVANGRLFVSTIDGKVRCFAGERTVGAREQPGRRSLRGGEEIVGVHASACPGSTLKRELQRCTPHESISVRGANGEDPPTVSESNPFNAARQMIDRAGVRRGYCLIVGSRDVRLAAAIARMTDLRVEVLASNAEVVPAMRDKLADAALYGGRVCVRPLSSGRLPYAPYVFNLVVDEASFFSGRPSPQLNELVRVTKPCGGMAVLGPRDTDADRTAASASPQDMAALAEEDNVTLEQSDNLIVLRRGRIPESTDWSHNYANAANTYSSDDPLVKGPFGVLWYGEPGPRQRIERHATPPMPLVVDGIMYTIGYDRVMAFDVYNAVRYWQREIQGATRTQLPINTSNLAADSSGLFIVVANERCLRLDAGTGKTLQTYDVPPIDGRERGYWAWIAVDRERLFGSRAEFDERRRGPQAQTSEAVFALDRQSGRSLWCFQGQGIDHDGIALGNGKLFLVDRQLSAQEREQASKRGSPPESRRAGGLPHGDSRKHTEVADREAIDRRGKPIPPDLRKLVILDVVTGRPLRQIPLDVTDITIDDLVVQGRGGVACMYQDGVVVVHGTGSLGHPHREFLAGEFARRALYAFDADTGEYLWGGRKGYRKRPIICGDFVYAEPFAWHLKTGELKEIDNPLSGRSQAFDFHRGYIGCGHVLASGSALFGARGGIGYCNLEQQRGFAPFAGMALACGICAVPANGVFIVPEGRSGCTCATPIYTSVGLYPDPTGGDWSIGFAGGRTESLSLPVRQVSINLGAPGYREDPHGTLWIPYPARVDGGPLGGWLPTYQHDDQMCYRLADLHTKITGTETPWVFTSGYANEKPLRFPMNGAADPPANYTVTLYFAEPNGIAPGQRRFSVDIQGKTVLEDLDVCREAGGPRTALTKQVTGIEVSGHLEIHLRQARGSRYGPILCGFRADRN